MARCYESSVQWHSLCGRLNSPKAYIEMEFGVRKGFSDQYLEGNGEQGAAGLGRERS